MICACRSVGKPGYGAVFIFILLIFLFPIIWISSFLTLIFAPIFLRVSISVLIILGMTFLIFKFPSVAAAATK